MDREPQSCQNSQHLASKGWLNVMSSANLGDSRNSDVKTCFHASGQAKCASLGALSNTPALISGGSLHAGLVRYGAYTWRGKLAAKRL